MSLLVIIMQIIFTIPLFCIVEYFDKRDISLIEKILIPVIYIIIISALCSEIKSNIYLITFFLYLFQSFYNNNVTNRDILISKKEYFIRMISSLLLSIFIYYYYINELDVLIPSAEEFRSLFWFLIIIFIYNLLKNNVKSIEKKEKTKFIERKREYVIVSFAKFKNKYYKIIKSKDSLINNLVYAVMIYENYKVPSSIRYINVVRSRFTKEKVKYGIMQVESDHEISDEESIKIFLKELEKSYKKIDSKKKDITIIKEILNYRYNDEDILTVIDIYNEIIEFENR